MARFRHLVAGAVLSAAFVSTACGAPPEKEMQQAQQAIDIARAAGADRYARDEYTAAEDALKQANAAVADRDYRQALNYALDSRERAQTAASEAADNKAKAKAAAAKALADANAALADARQHLKTAEAGHAAPRALAAPKRQIAGGEQAVQKARAAFDGGDYLTVPDEARAAATGLRSAAKDLEAIAKAPAPKPAHRRRR